MATSTIPVEDGIAQLVIDNPPVNVLRTKWLVEMARAVTSLGEARLLLIRGAGRCFSAGMDIEEHLPQDVAAMLQAARCFFHALWMCECPLLAAVHGNALGGAMELLLLCDFVVAREDAVFGLPEIKVGSYPPLAAVLLPRLLPWPRAAELLLQGRTLSAAEACSWGLVNAVLPADGFDRQVSGYVAKVCALSPAVQRHAKRAMRLGDDPFERLAAVEKLYLDELMRTEDAVEGLRAFLEKRAARWVGR